MAASRLRGWLAGVPENVRYALYPHKQVAGIINEAYEKRPEGISVPHELLVEGIRGAARGSGWRLGRMETAASEDRENLGRMARLLRPGNVVPQVVKARLKHFRLALKISAGKPPEPAPARKPARTIAEWKESRKPKPEEPEKKRVTAVLFHHPERGPGVPAKSRLFALGSAFPRQGSLPKVYPAGLRPLMNGEEEGVRELLYDALSVHLSGKPTEKLEEGRQAAASALEEVVREAIQSDRGIKAGQLRRHLEQIRADFPHKSKRGGVKVRLVLNAFEEALDRASPADPRA
ncbi:MAG: hypothetical protein V1787_03100 [Candidatus Micrarchaeota archaeon]